VGFIPLQAKLVSSAVTVLPSAQLHALQQAYAHARNAKRRAGLAGAAILLVCIVASAVTAEVDPSKFWANIGRFTNYFGRLLVLESGNPVWSDLSEWYWGFYKWSYKIGETLIIAYLGTVVGGIGAFVLCFLSARNIVQNNVVLFAARRFLEFFAANIRNPHTRRAYGREIGRAHV